MSIERYEVLRRIGLGIALVGAWLILCGTQLREGATVAEFYVSRDGANTAGTSWATAWSELNRINWSVVQPGDIVWIDGGATSMQYNTELVIPRSGTATAPITIKLSTEPGRDGQAIFFGGRSTPLPDMNTPAANYTYDPGANVRTQVVFYLSSYVVLDGSKWRGILIKGASYDGINMYPTTHHNTVRNVEITDVGYAFRSGYCLGPDDPVGPFWYSNGYGLNLYGSYHTVERAIIHDNGTDTITSGGPLSNFTLRDSWLYMGRAHSTNAGLAYSDCRKPDGMEGPHGSQQVGTYSNFLYERCVIGPGLAHGLLLGGPSNPPTIVTDVTIRNCLLLNNRNINMSTAITAGQRWTIENVTSWMAQYNGHGATHYASIVEGTGHVVRDSIFYGGVVIVSGTGLGTPCAAVTTSGNYQFNNGATNVGCSTGAIGTNADPLFVAAPTWAGSPTLQQVIDGNYALQGGSPAAGKGSSLTSVAQLLAEPAPVTTHLYGLQGQGTLAESINTAALASAYSAGVRLRMLELDWNALQPLGAAGLVTAAVAQYQAKINAFVATGADTKIVLDLGMHSTPAWVAAIDPLIDQHGNVHDATGGDGGANVYWSWTVRAYAANYIKTILQALDFQGRLYAVRIGPYQGEMTYPHKRNGDNSVSFWAYDQHAQAACPFPGWEPGQESLNGDARFFYEWYVDTLADTANVLIEIVQKYAPAGTKAAVVMPGFGEINETAVALMVVDLLDPARDYYGTGNWWERLVPQLNGYGEGEVLLWPNSIGDGSGSNDASIDRTLWSTAKLFNSYAVAAGLSVFAENTGQNEYDVGTRDTMQWIMDAVSEYPEFVGLLWVKESEMSTGYATLANYATEIAAHP